MELVEPVGHGPILERLWRAALRTRLPHAILFEGAPGIGKFTAARWFAAGLMCSAGPAAPCGQCGPCKRVRSGNHPDLLTIDAVADGEERIRVARIAIRPDGGDEGENAKSLEAFLDLCALESSTRVVLIRECHRMNDPAQNALLKTLEEPRPGTLLILETHHVGRLLPTILSRCIRLRFNALSLTECERVLAESAIANTAELSRWTEGAPGMVLAWSERGGAEIRALLAAALRGEQDPLGVAAALWEVEGEFAGKTPTARARDRARFVVELALAIARDGNRRAAGMPVDALAHGDLADRVVGVSNGALPKMLSTLLECLGDIDRNLGPEPVLERALLALSGRVPILGGAAVLH